MPDLNAQLDQMVADATFEAGLLVEVYGEMRAESGEVHALAGLTSHVRDMPVADLQRALIGAIHRLAVPEPDLPTVDDITGSVPDGR